MIGFLFATLREAEPFLRRVEARKVGEEPFEAYEFSCPGTQDDGVILICGMGNKGAASATEYLIAKHRVNAVINAGICATAADDIKIGEVFRIIQAREEGSENLQEDTFACEAESHAMGKTRLAHLPSARLTTVDTAVFDPARRRQIGKWGELVDMEGAAIARICTQNNIPWCLVKGVSDRADHDGKQAIQKNIDAVSEKVAMQLFNALAELSSKKLSRDIFRFIKIEHTVFSLPLLFAGAWLGAGQKYPSLKILLLIVLAAVGARTIGMAMNRIIDRNIDASNPRTANRELPQGRLSLIHAYAVVVFGMVLYLTACFILGGWCWTLWPIPFIPLMTYSFLKRFTDLCHFGIGISLGLAPLCAYVAASGTLNFNSSVLYLALFTFCWITGADIVYALMDIDFDKRAGVHSLPVRLGAAKAQLVAGTLHVIAFLSASGILCIMRGGGLAWLALLVVAASFVGMYVQQIPIHIRFFPISAVAGVAGALVPLFS